MKRSSLLLSGILALSCATAAHAQIITPTGVTVTSDADVVDISPVLATYAQLVVPDYFGGPTPDPLTVNGVTFTTALTQNGVTLSLGGGFGTDIGYQTYGTNGGPLISSNFQSVLTPLLIISENSAHYLYNADQPTTGTLTLSGLTPGQAYTLQIFEGGQDGLTGGTETIKDTTTGSSAIVTTSAPGSGDSYVLDIFTAGGGGSESISFTPLVGADGYFAPAAVFNAINLEAGVVPEPSTYALVLGSLAFLGFCVRRKLA